MSITKLIGKIKNISPSADLGTGEEISFDKDGHIERFPRIRKLFLSIVILLVALLSFGIGRLSVVSEWEPVKIEYDLQLTTNNLPPTTNNKANTASVINAVGNGNVVVSKNGARYHYSHCSGAKQIKEENKIIFATSEAAEAAGYTLASNCKPR